MASQSTISARFYAETQETRQQNTELTYETVSENRSYALSISQNTTQSKIYEYNTAVSSTDMPTDTEGDWGLKAFQVCLIFMGGVGLLGNALVLFILKKNEAGKKTTNILIMNQMSLDMISCVFLIIGHALQLQDNTFVGTWGFINCTLFYVDTGFTMSQMGSIGSLVAITFERYVKIVHPISHRKHFRKWMVNAAIVATWINGMLTEVTVFWTSEVVDGQCQAWLYFQTPELPVAFGYAGVTWEYILPLASFLYFYGHILIVIRRSNKVFTGVVNHANNFNQNQANVSQAKIIRTLIMVTVAFAICWAPTQVYYVMYLYTSFPGLYFYSITLLITIINVSINPFIYSSSHVIVRKQLNEWLRGRAKTTGGVATVAVNMTT